MLLPYDEALAVSFVSVFGLYRERRVANRVLLYLCKTFLLCIPLSFLSNGCDNLANLLENFPIWFTIPRNRLNSEVFLGVFISSIAFVLCGLAWIPFWPTI